MAVTTAVELVHVLSATVPFGTGLGPALLLWRTARSCSPASLEAVTATVLAVDRPCIAPGGVVQLVTAGWLVEARGYSLTDAWTLASVGLYAPAGVARPWGVLLERRIRSLPRSGGGRPDPVLGHFRGWVTLGVVAFAAVALSSARWSSNPRGRPASRGPNGCALRVVDAMAPSDRPPGTRGPRDRCRRFQVAARQ